MAKERRVCPFSGKTCKKCSIYRGRHQYLSFSERNRGRIEGVAEESNKNVSAGSTGTGQNKG